MGIQAEKSILSRWMHPDGSLKCSDVCTTLLGLPITQERDWRLVAQVMADLFCLDASWVVKSGHETDLLSDDEGT